MAQSGSAPEWGSGGRRFESGRPDYSNVTLSDAGSRKNGVVKGKRADRRITLVGPCFAQNDGVLAYLCRHRCGEAHRPAAGGGARWRDLRQFSGAPRHADDWQERCPCRRLPCPGEFDVSPHPSLGARSAPGKSGSAPRYAPRPAISSPSCSLGVSPRRATTQRIRLIRPLSMLPWARRRVPDKPAPLRPGGRRLSLRLHRRGAAAMARPCNRPRSHRPSVPR